MSKIKQITFYHTRVERNVFGRRRKEDKLLLAKTDEIQNGKLTLTFYNIK